MKKLFLFATFCSFFLSIVSAQNASPYWSLAGNSNATNTSKFGTTNNTSIQFYTNNKQRMIINSAAGLVGIGTTTPAGQLHVNSPAGTNPFRADVNGSIKFIINSNGGAAIGGSSTPPVNGLYVSGNLAVGTTSPQAKLHVSNTSGNGIYVSAQNYGLQASASSSSGYGVSASSKYIGVYGNGTSYGIYGVSSSSTGVYGTGAAYGVNGYSGSSTGVYGDGSTGVYGRGTNTGVYGVGSTYGVYGYSSGYGVFGYSTSSVAGYFSSYSSHGIWAVTSSTASNVYAGVFQGNVYTYNTYLTSDQNLKKNIQDFSGALSIINKLKPKNYEFRSDEKYASLQLPKGNHYGLLAQDLEQVLPGIVRDAPLVISNQAKTDIKSSSTASATGERTNIKQQDKTPEILNTKAVNYTELIPIIIKGMQELSSENQELKKEVSALKAVVQNLNKANGFNVPHTSAFIKQNAPNPSNTNTVISYYTPDDTNNAKIVLTDIRGSVLKVYSVPRGEGQISIKSGELSSGTYNYTLYVNNSKIDTKQMVISK